MVTATCTTKQEISAHLAKSKRALLDYVAAYEAALRDYNDPHHELDEMPIFLTHHRTNGVLIAAHLTADPICMAKSAVKDWTIYHFTKKRKSGDTFFEVRYIYAPQCGAYYQCLPIQSTSTE